MTWSPMSFGPSDKRSMPRMALTDNRRGKSTVAIHFIIQDWYHIVALRGTCFFLEVMDFFFSRGIGNIYTSACCCYH